MAQNTGSRALLETSGVIGAGGSWGGPGGCRRVQVHGDVSAFGLGLVAGYNMTRAVIFFLVWGRTLHIQRTSRNERETAISTKSRGHLLFY